MAGEPVLALASDFWLISDPETGGECGYLLSAGWIPDLDLAFEGHLPDEYAEDPGEPVCATLARAPFTESVNPTAREQATIHTDYCESLPPGDGILTASEPEKHGFPGRAENYRDNHYHARDEMAE